MTIIQLSQNIINKIAAGEVIERPCNIVKELVENSIDANSKRIFVEIRNGGKTYIKIEDDGDGLSKEDATIATDKHTTSKINQFEDIYNIYSYGFRGEALNSISSVSEFELNTNNGLESTKVIIKDKEKNVISSSKDKGTTIIIKNLFFNIPVRMKFLKSNSKETSKVVEKIIDFALIHPEVHFKLISNSKELINYPSVSSIKERVISVFGLEYSNNLVNLDFSEEDISVTGVLGSKEIFQKNKSKQFVYVNKRRVNSKLVEKAIFESYHTFLKKHDYPFFIINLSIHPDLIDVNVHPKKEEIRFNEEKKIFGICYFGAKIALSNYYNEKNSSLIKTDTNYNSFDENNNSFYETNEKKDFEIQKKRNLLKETILDDYFVNDKFVINKKKEAIKEDLSEIKELFVEKTKVEDEIRDKINNNDSKNDDLNVNILESKKEILSSAKNLINENNSFNWNFISTWKYLGSIKKTFLLFEYDDGLILSDFHAMHERINYERFMKEYQNKQIKVQQLLSPKVFELPLNESILLEEQLDKLKEFGIVIEHFGKNEFILREIPIIINKLANDDLIKQLIDDILKEISTQNSFDNAKEDIIKQISCKSSYHAGDDLNEVLVKKLLKDLSNTENPFTCPHGRPSIVKFNLDELWKLFRRD